MRRTGSRRLWLPLAAAATAALPLPSAAHAQTASAAAASTMAPAADLYVSKAEPTRNFGASRQLVISRVPARRGYVRFQLDGAPAPNTRAILYLFPLSTSKAGLRLRHASDAPWNEKRITLRRGEPGTGPRVVRTGALQARRWKAVDVTHLMNNSGVVALSLGAAGAKRVVLASRESAHNGVRLALQRADSPVSPTPPVSSATPAAAPAQPQPAPQPAPAPAPGPPAATPTSSRPCGGTSSPPAWKHVVWIVMENKASSQIVGSSGAPYINALAGKCGNATNFFGITHPSLPNYIAMTAGDTRGVTDDAAPSSHPLTGPTIFSQLGPDWRSLQESMSSNCQLTSSGLYAVKHNPAAYFTDIRGACNAQDVPLKDPPDLSARFTFITPNMCSSMHDCSVNEGDAWLSRWMPKFLDSPQYQAGNTAVFLTFDEDDHSANNHIATLVVSPSTPAGRADGVRYDHYSLLRTTEEMLGLPAIGGAFNATSMRAGFNL